MNDRAAARYVFLPARENVRETARTIHDRNRVIFDPGKEESTLPKIGVARSPANLFAIETRPKKREEKRDEPRKRRRRGSDGRDRSCFAYRRIYEPVKPVVSLSPEGKLQPPNGSL